jgi:enoyl-CoA hydratase/carnithine racemase
MQMIAMRRRNGYLTIPTFLLVFGNRWMSTYGKSLWAHGCRKILESIMTEIRSERRDQFLWVTIARPQKKNALRRAEWLALQGILELAQADPSLRGLILQAQGEAFCAGADISELQANIHDANWMQENHAIVQQTNFQLQNLLIPTLCLIDGDCFGGGLGLATACDFRFASERTRFALTPAKLGLSYSVADVTRLWHLIGPAGCRELLYLAPVITAKRAERMGLCALFASALDLQSATQTWCEQIVQTSGASHRAIKQNLLTIAAGQTSDDSASYRRFADMFGGVDFTEGASAFIGKRSPNFQRDKESK